MKHSRLLALTAIAVALALPATALAAIQPGASIESQIGAESGFCTLNWIYDGPGGPYAGTAAHCVEGPGAVVNLATGSLGTVIERIGTVALRGDPDTPGRDYSLIRIDPDRVGEINPALIGHPKIPTGVSHNYKQGNLMQFSGNGLVFHLTALTREQRIGVLNAVNGGHHDILGAVTPGDSGGPVGNISDNNTAFGVVDTVGVGVNTSALSLVTVGEGGSNLDFVLQDAAAHGFPVTLRTVH